MIRVMTEIRQMFHSEEESNKRGEGRRGGSSRRELETKKSLP